MQQHEHTYFDNSAPSSNLSKGLTDPKTKMADDDGVVKVTTFDMHEGHAEVSECNHQLLGSY
jgi:hypothetical protein